MPDLIEQLVALGCTVHVYGEYEVPADRPDVPFTLGDAAECPWLHDQSNCVCPCYPCKFHCSFHSPDDIDPERS